MDSIDRRIHQLEAEVTQLNQRLADTSAHDRKRRVELRRTIKMKSEELSSLRYRKKTPEEREQYWVWATNHQMRVQCEAGMDEYAIFDREWLEATRAWEPQIEQILVAWRRN